MNENKKELTGEQLNTVIGGSKEDKGKDYNMMRCPRCGAPNEVCRALMEQVTTDGCIAVLDAAGLRERVMDSVLRAVQTHLDRRAAGALIIGAVTFSNEYGLLGMTDTAARLVDAWRENG